MCCSRVFFPLSLICCLVLRGGERRDRCLHHRHHLFLSFFPRAGMKEGFHCIPQPVVICALRRLLIRLLFHLSFVSVSVSFFVVGHVKEDEEEKRLSVQWKRKVGRETTACLRKASAVFIFFLLFHEKRGPGPRCSLTHHHPSLAVFFCFFYPVTISCCYGSPSEGKERQEAMNLWHSLSHTHLYAPETYSIF